MKYRVCLTILIYCVGWSPLFSQLTDITINAQLNTELHSLNIQQEITYYNNSNEPLSSIYFHNWANAFMDKNTPLGKRFVENYSKSFHFAKEKHRGNSIINSISINYEPQNWEITTKDPDILKIPLHNDLAPGESVKIVVTYTVKIPHDKFTKYGFGTDVYNLKYWYLIPAVFDGEWKLYNHLDLDDLYTDLANYQIHIEVPNDFKINSGLDQQVSGGDETTIYHLSGREQLDVELNITRLNDYLNFEFDNFQISTNLNYDKLSENLKTTILKREFYFLELNLGKLPLNKLMINKIEYEKNPVYGFNQLPSFLAPYSNAFEWDIKMFKVLSKKFIDQIMLVNKREDAWLADGIHTYLMIKYVEKFYPEIRAIGSISRLWGIRNFNLAKISFNEKYPFVYQFAARKNLDQALTLPADSLSNFNRKIVNKYKAGLGLKYLDEYLEDLSIPELIHEFTFKNSRKRIHSNSFLKLVKSKTNKNIDWFENDFLKTNKKADYTIENIVQHKDSLEVELLNKRNQSLPVQLYGIKDGEIKFKKWVQGFDSIKKVTIPTNGFDQLSLNYESLMPEYNLRNNWKGIKSKLLNRPLQIKFLKDIENPYYNQFFYAPVARYNYYDGLVLGLALSNKTILNKSFQYKITPSYSTKSRSFSGSYSFLYEYLPENKKVNKFLIGLGGNKYHYAPNLTYQTILPFALLEFKRKNLRDVKSKSIVATYTMIDKEPGPELSQHLESYKYNVFNIGFGYAKPEIIEDIRFSTGLQLSSKFNKISLTARYRKLTDTNRQFDFRFFAGAFITNKTASNYFSFALDRPSDYLFQYDYLGRSETTGIFSQQIIINEGGFKSKLPVAHANQWLTTLNTSVGLWRWFEIYNDVGFVKNKHEKVYFAHENGVRLNFIQDILEVYFPFHSNLGWEITQPHYSTKIRFVLVLQPKQIYNFVRRGFY